MVRVFRACPLLLSRVAGTSCFRGRRVLRVYKMDPSFAAVPPHSRASDAWGGYEPYRADYSKLVESTPVRVSAPAEAGASRTRGDIGCV